MRSIVAFLIGMVVALTTVVHAQQIPALEREVTLNIQDETADAVLTKIASLTGIKFSYSPSFIPVNKRISLQVYRKPIRSVLYLMFGENVRYKTKGNFIILTSTPHPEKKAPPPEVLVSGYVYNTNGDPVAFASILNKREQMSAVTNKYGYYQIKTPVHKLPLTIEVKKQHYQDTLIKIARQHTQVDIVIQEAKTSPVVVVQRDSIVPADTSKPVVAKVQQQELDTVKSVQAIVKDIERWLLSESMKANIRNISDTIFSGIQFSVIPGLSTNSLLSGNTVNKVSVSLLAGYNKGVTIGAVAGLANIISGNARYGLGAGVLNVVKDSMIGVEASGMFNLNGGFTQGAQLAGFGNINRGDLIGMQGSGYFNVVKGNLTGVQVSGFSNITTGNLRGLQMAGFVNSVNGGVEGTQIAGFVNRLKGDIYGSQVSGFANITYGNGSGLQIAGLGNYASGEIIGSQISSVFNYAHTLHGLQIGLINWSDSCDGLPIGLISYSNKGYHKIEVSFDEMMQTQLSFRLGVQKFHNIFNIGVDLTNNIDGLWNFGYGLGTYKNLNEHWRFGGELMAQLFLKGDQISSAAQVNSLFVGFDRQFGKRFSIGIGPAFRVLNHYADDTTVSDALVPYSFYSADKVSLWAGGKFTIKFL